MKKSYWRRTGVRRAYIVAGVLLVLAAELQGRSQSLASVFVVDRENVVLFADRLGGGQGGLCRPGDYRYRKVTHTVRGMLDSLGDERHTYFLTPVKTEEKLRCFPPGP